MQVEMSLAEMLINAIAHGRIRGVQLKRNWKGPDTETHADLSGVIQNRIGSALSVAREEGRRLALDDFEVSGERARLREYGDKMRARCEELARERDNALESDEYHEYERDEARARVAALESELLGERAVTEAARRWTEGALTADELRSIVRGFDAIAKTMALK